MNTCTPLPGFNSKTSTDKRLYHLILFYVMRTERISQILSPFAMTKVYRDKIENFTRSGMRVRKRMKSAHYSLLA